MMYGKKSKIINFNGAITKLSSNNISSDTQDMIITFFTDDNVSISINIPIRSICMVSEVANYKMYHDLEDSEKIHEYVRDIANSYKDLFSALGVRVMRYEVSQSDKD